MPAVNIMAVSSLQEVLSLHQTPPKHVNRRCFIFDPRTMQWEELALMPIRWKDFGLQRYEACLYALETCMKTVNARWSSVKKMQENLFFARILLRTGLSFCSALIGMTHRPIPGSVMNACPRCLSTRLLTARQRACTFCIFGGDLKSEGKAYSVSLQSSKEGICKDSCTAAGLLYK